MRCEHRCHGLDRVGAHGRAPRSRLRPARRRPAAIPLVKESSALGAAPCAGVGAGYDPSLLEASASVELETTVFPRATAAAKYREMRRAGIAARVVEDVDAVVPALARADVIVDALLGTGARGAPAPLVARLITAINGSGRPVLALDIPSGLPADGAPVTVPSA